MEYMVLNGDFGLMWNDRGKHGNMEPLWGSYGNIHLMAFIFLFFCTTLWLLLYK